MSLQEGVSVWPSVIVVLVNFNGAKDTERCLRSLQALQYANFSTVLVENGSSDNSYAELARAFPELPIIRCSNNQGFSVGCNVGVRYALVRHPDYVWVLNNDTVTEPTSLTAMVQLAEQDAKAGVVGAIVRDMAPPHNVQAWGGGRVAWWRGVPRHYHSRPESGRLDYIYGASILVRRAVFEEVGLFDEGFHLYWEDTDFGVRARRAGWCHVVAEAAIIYHSGGPQRKSLPRSLASEMHFNESAVRFLCKHSVHPLASIAISVTGRALKRMVYGHWRAAASVLRGAMRGFTRRKSIEMDRVGIDP